METKTTPVLVTNTEPATDVSVLDVQKQNGDTETRNSVRLIG